MMYASLSSDDEDSLQCYCRRGCILPESGMCGRCTYDWISDNSISQNLEEAGGKHGESVATDQAVSDTIYQRARDNYYLFDCDDAPDYANMDRESYSRGFEDGYYKVYNEVYYRHRPMLDELRQIHAQQWMKLRILARFELHPLLDLQLLGAIEKYLPSYFLAVETRMSHK